MKRSDDKCGNLAADAAGWIQLAAAPTFATMALLTLIRSGGPPDMLCSIERHVAPLSGMSVMYLLMSAFHLAPWLSIEPAALTAFFQRRSE